MSRSACSSTNCVAGCYDGKINILDTTATVVDLTHSLDSDTIMWPGNEGFNLCMSCGIVDPTPNSMEPRTASSSGEITEADPYFYSAGTFSCAEHGGTHIDAPYNFAEGGATVDAIPPTSLIGTCRCIDITEVSVVSVYIHSPSRPTLYP